MESETVSRTLTEGRVSLDFWEGEFFLKEKSWCKHCPDEDGLNRYYHQKFRCCIAWMASALMLNLLVLFGHLNFV